jgi:hypothetical protein
MSRECKAAREVGTNGVVGSNQSALAFLALQNPEHSHTLCARREIGLHVALWREVLA